MSGEETPFSSVISVVAADQTEELNGCADVGITEYVQTKEEKSRDKQDGNKDIDDTVNDNTCVSNTKSSEIPNTENEGTERIASYIAEEALKTATNDPDVRNLKTTRLLQKIDELDEKYLCEYLRDVPEDELLDAIKETEQINSDLLKENEIYEFILNEDETVQSSLDNADMDEEFSAQKSFVLSYPEKCCLAKMKLEHTEKELEMKKAGFAHELQNLNFELESLNLAYKELTESKEKFDKNIRIGGRHPVTKKIILQKIAKFFDDSFKKKMALTNRYRVQIQNDIMEHNKILSQIKAQEKRLASLDMAEFQITQSEYKKSCKELSMCKEQLGKLKAKFGRLVQNITEMKKVLELKATMRKIKLDPRRHNLPEVIDYAAAKRENATLKKNVDKWKRKVELVQQKKLLYLSALSKKDV